MCYVVAVKKASELRIGKGRGALRLGMGFVVVLFSSIAFVCCGAANGYTPILYPTIFWHDNQWETYENGQWVPYRGSANNNSAFESEPAELTAPDEPQPPEMVDTNVYAPTYGWGFIGAPALYRSHHHRAVRGHVEHRRPVNGLGRSNVGIGQTTIGIGRPNAGIGRANVGMGQTTIGIGRGNAGMGQPTIGVRRPNVGIGQPNAGIGRTAIGIGQPNVGIGQPSTGIGQPNATVGQPTVGIGTTTIGIGQPMSGQSQTRGR